MYKFKSLADMFEKSSRIDKEAYRQKINGKYQPISYTEFRKKVMNFHFALAKLGITKGSKVAIVSENRVEWAITDYGVISHGAILIPIYPSLTAEQDQYILLDSDSELLLISQEQKLKELKPLLDTLSKLKTIVTLFPYTEKTYKQINFISFDDFLASGEKIADEKKFTETSENVGLSEIASIVYTSGTTGYPKGVLLTHENILSNIESCLSSFKVGKEDVLLSFLPLCHIFERMGGHFLPVYLQATIAYAESIETVAQNILEIQPTLMTSVPRFYEKVYSKILDAVEKGPESKRKIFNWAIALGKEVAHYKKEKLPLPISLKIKHSIAHKLVYSKMCEKMGGKLKFFVSGGAPLQQHIGEFFEAVGIVIIEGYGMTETSPVIALNKLDDYKFGTVGKPISAASVKIAHDGEILTKGPSITQGYYKNPEATKELIDEEGWLHTGDIGMFDQDGFLKITDRKKNLLVTAGGKNIAPQPIEDKLKNSKFIADAVLIGDLRNFVSAIIVPDFDQIRGMIKDEIHKLILSEVEKNQQGLAGYEKIKKIIVLDEPLTIENGELTPTMKIKRKVILQKYENEINSLYNLD
ncbi:long-chain fatty acid--CoA ligase [bacterium]|nr:long-chain fatty acid--CoA ligase [bacterium]